MCARLHRPRRTHSCAVRVPNAVASYTVRLALLRYAVDWMARLLVILVCWWALVGACRATMFVGNSPHCDDGAVAGTTPSTPLCSLAVA
eukprot:COSAG02_NODE_48676_length_332_cov_0.660944_1_plen_88_part_10